MDEIEKMASRNALHRSKLASQARRKRLATPTGGETMRNLSDGEREVLAEADDDAHEAEMAWRKEEREDEERAGNFASEEAERAMARRILDEIEANGIAAGWTHWTDDLDIDATECSMDDEHPW